MACVSNSQSWPWDEHTMRTADAFVLVPSVEFDYCTFTTGLTWNGTQVLLDKHMATATRRVEASEAFNLTKSREER